MRLDEPIERHGVFWLPGNESIEAQGVLRIETTGQAALTVRYESGLSGASTLRAPWHEIWTGKPAPPTRLVGQVGLQYATLEGCTLAGGSPGFATGALSEARFRVRRVLLGAAYDRNDDIAFSRLSFSADGLTCWLSPDVFRAEHNDAGRLRSIRLREPAPVEWSLGDGLVLRLNRSYTYQLTRPPTEYRFRQAASAELCCEEPRRIDELLEVAGDLRRFLCLATSETVFMKKIAGRAPEGEACRTTSESSRVRIQVFDPHDFAEFGPREALFDRMLFNYRDVADKLELLFRNWLELCGTARVALDSYFAVASDRERLLETRFLLLAQALEVLHSRTHLDDGKKKLCTRVAEIVAPFNRLFGGEEASRDFARKVAVTRNYLVHYNPAKEAEAVDLDSLPAFSRRLEVLCQLHLLKRIGMSVAEIERIVANNQTLKARLGLA